LRLPLARAFAHGSLCGAPEPKSAAVVSAEPAVYLRAMNSAPSPDRPPSESPQAVLEALAEDFDLLDAWEQQLEYVIDLGRSLPPLASSERSDANRVRGCASQVWLVTETGSDGRLWFRADSDAQIPKGLIAVLLRIYSGRRPEEIASLDPAVAADRLGLAAMLTQQRTNGLAAMIEKIRQAARLTPS